MAEGTLNPEEMVKGIVDMKEKLGMIAGSALRADAASVISEFNGHGDINKWLEEIEKFRTIHNLNADGLIQVAYSRARDDVSKFIGRLMSDSTPATPLTWTNLKKALVKAYSSVINAAHWFSKLRAIKQRKDEGIQAFTIRMMDMVEQAYPSGWETAQGQFANPQLISIFLDAINSQDLKRRLYKKNLTTLKEVIAEATMDDQVGRRFPTMGGFSRNYPAGGPRAEEPMEIADRRVKLTCYHCKGPHKIKFCPNLKPEERTRREQNPKKTYEVRERVPIRNPERGAQQHFNVRQVPRCYACNQPGHFIRECKQALNTRGVSFIRRRDMPGTWVHFPGDRFQRM